jgi:hypothetical protein
LLSIEIPSSVTIIEEASFEGCYELESCLIPIDSSLVRIGGRAFAKCGSLRSLEIPPLIGEIDRNCFTTCIHLYQLKFWSSESLKRIVGDRSLDDALEEFGVSVRSSLFRIDVGDEGVEMQFAGWARDSVPDDDGNLHLTLVPDPQ